MYFFITSPDANDRLYEQGLCYFLVPDKKVTKEAGIGAALYVLLPQSDPPAPLSRLLFALFLPKQEKGNITFVRYTILYSILSNTPEGRCLPGYFLFMNILNSHAAGAALGDKGRGQGVDVELSLGHGFL